MAVGGTTVERPQNVERVTVPQEQPPLSAMFRAVVAEYGLIAAIVMLASNADRSKRFRLESRKK